jgi:hypothetical protein
MKRRREGHRSRTIISFNFASRVKAYELIMAPIHPRLEFADRFIIPGDPEYTLALSPSQGENPIRQEGKNNGDR